MRSTATEDEYRCIIGCSFCRLGVRLDFIAGELEMRLMINHEERERAIG